MSLAQLLGSKKPLAAQAPWPRYGVDEIAWTDIAVMLGAGKGDLLALWSTGDQVHLALRAPGLVAPCVVSLDVHDGAFASVGRWHAPAIRPERAICDLWGLTARDAPDPRPWLDHGAWGVRAPLGDATEAPLRDPADYPFQEVIGEGLHQIPVGPVHAGIIEPGHFRFTANGETVARLEARLGYVHKGIDRLMAGADLAKAARLAARISGDSTVAYSFAFARAIEAALGIAVPERAVALRGVMAELERIANHLGDIGAICNDAAFALIHAHCGILRERVLQVCDAVFGHRLMMDLIVPGGVARDLNRAQAAAILAALDRIAAPFAEVVRVYDATPSLQDRTCQTGAVAADLVARFAAGGFVGRASGRHFDTRRDLAYPPYAALKLDVPVFDKGDVDARVWVRIREIEASIALLRQLLTGLPPGPVLVEFSAGAAAAAGEGAAMVEAFRGDVFVWVAVDAGSVRHAHLRDASWFQWPLLEAAIENNIVADFPLCNKSFNCSYSGQDL